MNQITPNMKPISFVLLILISISCNKNNDFYIGTWELNKENGLSTLTFSDNKKIHWNLGEIKILENEDFNTIKLSPNKFNILSGQGKNCTKITMQRLSDNQCVGCNYKCYIDENMIDEVFIARKNQHPQEPIQKPEKELIILPKDYEGDFFIVYQYSADNPSKEIKINEKGIGINQGEPDLRQLFNANRLFRFEGQEENITIANPNGYQGYFDPPSDSIYKDEKVIVIQQGINQTGRADWNKEYGEKVENKLNIEYFEIRRMKK